MDLKVKWRLWFYCTVHWHGSQHSPKKSRQPEAVAVAVNPIKATILFNKSPQIFGWQMQTLKRGFTFCGRFSPCFRLRTPCQTKKMPLECSTTVSTSISSCPHYKVFFWSKWKQGRRRNVWALKPYCYFRHSRYIRRKFHTSTCYQWLTFQFRMKNIKQPETMSRLYAAPVVKHPWRYHTLPADFIDESPADISVALVRYSDPVQWWTLGNAVLHFSRHFSAWNMKKLCSTVWR